ncbi:MAG: coenzyme F420-reducing hydrogenase, gamma subunit [Acidobacteria bacterium]|nr:coenzyme F420-reducing hydrogenase, gamma subunit [Acidobacteriota bacterium]
MVTPAPGGGAKLKVAMYWASSCGGCDISLLEIGPRLLELIDIADIVFWPCAADFKYADVAAYPDGYIDVCLFNGGIRSTEHEEVARLLRAKSRTLVAYGACANEGGIPSLANLSAQCDLFDAVYGSNPSLRNPAHVVPELRVPTPAGDLELPRQFQYVLRLQDVVPVDYGVPGCPPQADQVWSVLQLLAAGAVPARNSGVKVGCGDKSVCDECPREKRKVRITAFRRPHLAVPEPGWCLLEQGFVCSGTATRSGCGALCVKAGQACRGCYGPTAGTRDQGLALVAAIGSNLAAKDEAQAQEQVRGIADPAGTFYRFTVAGSLLQGRREPRP